MRMFDLSECSINCIKSPYANKTVSTASTVAIVIGNCTLTGDWDQGES